jgi:alpha-tubulin suppressor-like RCC1 family protein
VAGGAHRISRVASALALVLVSCAPSEVATTVRLEVRYEDAWGLGALDVELASAGRTTRTAAAHEVLIQLSDELADGPLEIAVSGYRGDVRYAAGSVAVTPVIGAEVAASVALERVPCGAFCVVGARRCEGDSVVICVQDGEHECPEWGASYRCSPDAPTCSLGECRDACIDECATGDRECVGSGAWRMCGQADSDDCLDWLTATACLGGEVCSLGTCRSECVDECTEGTVWCSGAGVMHCADRDLDGCLENGAPEPCPTGESCEAGECRPIESCADECAASACDGLTFRECGNYDLDRCLEPSPGTSCVRADACDEGMCGASGCTSTARVCDSPPAPSCLDEDTLLVYDSSGTCSGGACDYRSREQSCPRCPACDACAGVTCASPPNGCYVDNGTCTDGACSYAYRDGAGCDDGDPCTDGDTCRSGTCAGVERECATPPSACHAATGACSAGTCSYALRDGARCDDGNPGTFGDACSGGVCAGSLDSWAEVAVGLDHTCARRASGSVVCWGKNADGQLGDGTTSDRRTPVAVAGVADAVELALGAGFTCARRGGGTVVCWGANVSGQLGDGTTTSRSMAREVAGISDAVEVTAGGAHACARRATGAVLCWGAGSSGELGDGSTTSRSTPGPVSGPSDFVEIGAGAQHTCGRRSSGAVACWGANDTGQLGDGSLTGSPIPVAVAGLTDAAEIGVGAAHGCARRVAGTVVCWGDNMHGQIGDGSMGDRPMPRATRGITDAIELGLGSVHSCARRATGELVCWGNNARGQLGDGSTRSRSEPVAVAGLGDAVAIAAGGATTCARRASGGIACWGANESGQLGDGSTTDRSMPTAVSLP